MKVVYTHVTTLRDAGPSYDSTTGEVANHYIVVLGAKLWLDRPSDFAPGDRVRITITKEPDNALTIPTP